MTVKELIEKLKEFNSDLPVKIAGWDEGSPDDYIDTEDVVLREEDEFNLMVEII